MKLLRFRIHQFFLRRTHYLLLPKLNSIQMRVIEKRLSKLGGSVAPTGVLSARLKQGTVHVDPGGLCWSRSDPADALLPALPDVLACPKTKVPLKELASKYFTMGAGGPASLRLSLRLESGSTWKALRASDACALAPDEHEVACSLLRSLEGRCEVVTDYPEAGSTPLRIGAMRYFRSSIARDEAASTLRETETRGRRNSYVCRDGTLRGEGSLGLSDEQYGELFESLGEWCFLAP